MVCYIVILIADWCPYTLSLKQARGIRLWMGLGVEWPAHWPQRGRMGSQTLSHAGDHASASHAAFGGRPVGVPPLSTGRRSSTLGPRTCRGPKQSEAIRSKMKPSDAIRSHQKPSEAIRSHQKPSAAHMLVRAAASAESEETGTSVYFSAPREGSLKERSHAREAASRLLVVVMAPCNQKRFRGSSEATQKERRAWRTSSKSARGEMPSLSADQRGWLYFFSNASATPAIWVGRDGSGMAVGGWRDGGGMAGWRWDGGGMAVGGWRDGGGMTVIRG